MPSLSRRASQLLTLLSLIWMPTNRADADTPAIAPLFVHAANVRSGWAANERWHAIRLDETRVLDAAKASTALLIPWPDGRTTRFEFRRREVGLDGNWSWIGRDANGHAAILTFGDDAMFGRMSRGDGNPWQVTTRDGDTWLVEPGQVSSDPAAWRESQRDEQHFVPPWPPRYPNVPDHDRQRKRFLGLPATVDLVLGYSTGFLNEAGGASQATTRLTHLVAVTNQALADSLVASRIRVVAIVPVSYGDTSSNQVTLEALTGYACNPACAPQSVPTALQPLRAARDLYGADLVSLVRTYRVPQQGSCGSAWLLGSGGFTIDNADAPFGYSVVSDGSDIDEGTSFTYFCPDSTLAHHLGHNMGQQHNVEDSGGSTGTHSYAYGYRETSSIGFHTIMAERLPNSSQFAINHFANPAVNYANTGRPTGTATANNARSLELSMPLVAMFREQPDALFGNGFEP